MISPNAENIEGAADSLLKLDSFIRDSQLKELHSAMGAQIITKLGSTFPPTEDFKIGYMLGVQAARSVVAGSVKLALEGISPDDVL